MIAAITTVAAATAHTIVREARAKTEVLVSANSSGCLRWEIRSKRLLSRLHLDPIYLLPRGLEHRICLGSRLSSCSSAPRYSGGLYYIQTSGCARRKWWHHNTAWPSLVALATLCEALLGQILARLDEFLRLMALTDWVELRTGALV